MRYNFNKKFIRKGTDSIKWDFNKEFGKKENLIPLWVADMDFAVPREISGALKKRIKHPIYGYTGKPDSYYAAVINWFNRRHNFPLKKEWLLYTPGVVPAINFAVQAFTKPGDSIIIQPPVYYPFKLSIEANLRKVINNPLIFSGSRYTMDFTHLESCIEPGTKMIILCNPHNPVGRVWNKDELIRLGEIACNHNLLIVSDEIHCDIIMPGFRHIPIATLDKEIAERTITCTAPNKTFNIAGIASGNIIISNKKFYNQYNDVLARHGLGMANLFSLVATEAAYNYGEQWLNQLIDYLYSNYLYMKNFVASFLPSLKLYELEGTYLCWLSFSGIGKTEQEINSLLENKADLWLDEGSKFGEQGNGFQRINIATPKSRIKKAMENIRNSLI